VISPYCLTTPDGVTIDLLEALLRTIVMARPAKDSAPRWVGVSEATGHGATVSIALCKWAGLDPDEEMEPRGRDDE